jgi:cobalt/nickel transport system permease protein
VHIPDGFLATPVWAAMDVCAAPAVAYAARRAQRGLDESRIPLFGVMGAFVFAAQMVNFPVGPGTSGHLVGGALLACTLGPAGAAVVLTAILAIQALVFQDGGLLALGANVMNMAIAGVVVGYLPFRYLGAGKWRKWAVFGGGFLSVMASALCALAELLLSGVRMPGAVMGVSLALFMASALLEGAITLAVWQALTRLRPGLTHGAPGGRRLVVAGVGVAAVLLAAVGVVLASAAPDGLESLALRLGMASRERGLLAAPLAGYQLPGLGGAWLSKAGAGLAGLALVWGACLMASRTAAGRGRE